MADASEDYRGYRITVTPIKDCEDRWDFEYRIGPFGGGEQVRSRSKTANGYMTTEAACVAGIEVARTEIDNLLALDSTKAN
ncbi:hypothetical protein Q4S45_05425 [Massilia sp. R2A-15]|uniref:hypothetical protein n=1 Tax=Massilia sp. R2A-15 TaxID=3064278 RepID=UPI002735D688|nr:hypothetical protein [Massilia sp. R2A-15]WLI90563.1 hypothetical protein Q4S45_05425 [Massilia sp. R2A-15]